MFGVLSVGGDHSIARFSASVENVSLFIIDGLCFCFGGVITGTANFFTACADVFLTFFCPLIDLFPGNFISVRVGGGGG